MCSIIKQLRWTLIRKPYQRKGCKKKFLVTGNKNAGSSSGCNVGWPLGVAVVLVCWLQYGGGIITVITSVTALHQPCSLIKRCYILHIKNISVFITTCVYLHWCHLHFHELQNSLIWGPSCLPLCVGQSWLGIIPDSDLDLQPRLHHTVRAGRVGQSLREVSC